MRIKARLAVGTCVAALCAMAASCGGGADDNEVNQAVANQIIEPTYDNASEAMDSIDHAADNAAIAIPGLDSLDPEGAAAQGPEPKAVPPPPSR